MSRTESCHRTESPLIHQARHQSVAIPEAEVFNKEQPKDGWVGVKYCTLWTVRLCTTA